VSSVGNDIFLYLNHNQIMFISLATTDIASAIVVDHASFARM